MTLPLVQLFQTEVEQAMVSDRPSVLAPSQHYQITWLRWGVRSLWESRRIQYFSLK
ncbi:hypothetical protein [Nostoc sp. UHCC 0870]|uniref:hypothetical protein n=1 Tax=Nostoc sp. UHCC 0870 TaxID=2914041 RepID=UPI001EDD94BB|nr:hypothetical protein [Nostoc sp. UHCC 0870]UKP00931.1 hypothetical protein L6494_09760 [Nostoc sp. UHCC 0870]